MVFRSGLSSAWKYQPFQSIVHYISLNPRPATATLTSESSVGHVIYKTTSLSDGYIPDSQISSSIDVMNADYASCGISFFLAGTDRTLNSTWFDQVDPNRYVNQPRGSYLFLRTAANIRLRSSYQTAMKNQLRLGGANALNVYSVGFTSSSIPLIGGYATFPSSYASNPEDDGVVILYSSVPGGTAAPYDQGKTLTHESG